jgi:hypothetical protein
MTPDSCEVCGWRPLRERPQTSRVVIPGDEPAPRTRVSFAQMIREKQMRG